MKDCETCKYRGRIESMTCCDYILYTKQRRDCNTFPCDKYEKGKPNPDELRENAQNYSVAPIRHTKKDIDFEKAHEIRKKISEERYKEHLLKVRKYIGKGGYEGKGISKKD